MSTCGVRCISACGPASSTHMSEYLRRSEHNGRQTMADAPPALTPPPCIRMRRRMHELDTDVKSIDILGNSHSLCISSHARLRAWSSLPLRACSSCRCDVQSPMDREAGYVWL